MKFIYFHQRNSIWNVVCEMAAILSRPQCVKDWVSVNEIYWYPVFKWIAMTWQEWQCTRLIVPVMATWWYIALLHVSFNHCVFPVTCPWTNRIIFCLFFLRKMNSASFTSFIIIFSLSWKQGCFSCQFLYLIFSILFLHNNVAPNVEPCCRP